MKLYTHPFSSCCQKALIALYENDTLFEFRLLEGEAVFAEQTALWPVGKFRPCRTATSRSSRRRPSSSIWPYVIPACATDAPRPRQGARGADDAGCSTTMSRRRSSSWWPTPCGQREKRDAYGVADEKRMLDTAYAWLDERLAGRD